MTPTRAPFADSTVEQWDESMRVNVRSLYLFTRAVVPVMTKTGGGSIVNISSGGADHASQPFMPPGYLIYVVAKAALERYTSAVAPELRPLGITMNALRPGAVKTEHSTHELGEDFDWSGWKTPESVVPAVAFLAAQIDTDFTGRIVDVSNFGTAWARLGSSGVGMRLYDTARRAVVPFEPPQTVRMYVCGITPYDSTHLGHAATYLTYDLVVRRLEELGHDGALRAQRHRRRRLDPPQGARARRAVPRARRSRDAPLPQRHGRARDAAADAEPRATESIDQIIELVGRLLERGHAYLTHGTAYFDVSTFPRYGELSHYSEDRMVTLARERGGNPDDPHRRQPLDFVLWQPSAPDEPAWRAPFGVGRPGWHIECSAMAMHEHGPTLDLHGGGTDLIFPHHECEIAQSESLTGEPCARHWLHSAMVDYEGEKMSKSLGNLVFVSDLLKIADPRAIRLALDAPPLPPRLRVVRHRSRRGHRAAAPAARRGRARRRARSAAVRRARARRDRRRPRHAARARRARRLRRARSSTGRRRSRRAHERCASSAGCSASTSSARSVVAGANSERW